MADNAGSVQIWRKGYATTCQLSLPLVRAIVCFADSIDCRVDLVKVRRCSDTRPILADHLSKGQFCRFKDQACAAGWSLNPLPAAVAAAILAWVANPKADDELGQRILLDILNVNC